MVDCYHGPPQEDRFRFPRAPPVDAGDCVRDAAPLVRQRVLKRPRGIRPEVRNESLGRVAHRQPLLHRRLVPRVKLSLLTRSRISGRNHENNYGYSAVKREVDRRLVSERAAKLVALPRKAKAS